MCGILALLSTSYRKTDAETILTKLLHRGPDDFGIWEDANVGIVLGHRRLSILDLSPAGHQPMFSHNKRWVVTYNGEIYNWKVLRQNLEKEGIAFQSHSDTEILLEAINHWGLEKSLQRMVGMFAFALWDRQERRLYVARDRFGEKPLYYARSNGAWVVASELKAISQTPGLNLTVDEQAIYKYLQHNYIPAPYTIYKEAKKLRPASWAELLETGETKEHLYWDFSAVVDYGMSHPFAGTYEEATDELERLLNVSIGLQRVADVPVGAFLSGGIDSSTVVALMQAQGGEPVHTFSIGFQEKSYDESGYAAQVAKHLGTHHTEMIVTPHEAMNVIPELVSMYDEPYADSSAIPTVLVSRLARKHVTVSLSGDAGDEVFGGYNRYPLLGKYWNQYSQYPLWLRNLLKHVCSSGKYISRKLGTETWTERFRYREEKLCIQSLPQMYQRQISQFVEPSEILEKQHDLRADYPFHLKSPFSMAMATDTVQYLPDDILVKVDRAAMSCSLESRIPILDHRIVEWAWTLPESFKIDCRQTKKILRSVLYRYVPQKMLERPKMGFGVPVGDWVKGPMRDWAEALLSEKSLRETNVLNVAKTRILWEQHRDGIRDNRYRVWTILMLQDWLLQSKRHLP